MSTVLTSRLPPGPKPRYPLAHLFAFRKDSIGFLKNLAEQYGDIAHFTIGPLRIVLLNHPDYIREVLTTQQSAFIKGRPLQMVRSLLGEGLLTSEGEVHKKQSRLIQPAFHRNMLDGYAPGIVRNIQHTLADWRDGQLVEMKEAMTEMSIAIAGSALFGVDVHQSVPEINRALETATGLFGRIPLPFAEHLLKLPLPGTRRFLSAKARLDHILRKMIAEREKGNNDNGDLVSLLLRASRETGDEGMSRQQVRDEAITLFLTAFDTTSTALTWTWYLLSQHAGAEAALHRELDTVLQGRLPVAADLPNLKYTRMVFGESLRLYPPSYLVPRQAAQWVTIGGYSFPAGTIVLISPYLIHHDARFRANPETFDPVAWGQHAQGQRAKYEYFPFSRGPRSCIGEPFAWMQGVLVLATIASQWRLRMMPGHPVALQPLINLRPRYGMKMILEKRQPSHVGG
ncbi:cytochrome P450 [Flavihumibacter petaseus]|uniref:Putative cytochrome P450 n=1 Tax=Flavihumibacter petaseus NBRC 106054 TaxID=1220578 RepID=A0A0E9MUN3_9BACT|nr:cytochrome P450 [Flavihumibacter petaseus]GAO41447.1 putative cytochrome P450 [Flavihumibacter petaseus NBRC 106054]